MSRIERLSLLLKKLKLDGILISDKYNISYFSGFTGGTGYLFFSDTKRVIITDFRYTIQAKEETQEFEVIEISKEYNYFFIINDLIKKEKIQELGFESQSVLYSDYLDLKQKLIVNQLIPVNQEVSLLRAVKEQKELDLIKHAEEIGDIVFSKILNILKPGMTELEVAANLEYLMKINGAQGLSFDTIVASGIHSSMPHAIPTNKKLEKGDFLTMDFGCIYQGYCSDMTRTVVIGKASEKQKKIYQIVLQAQKIALEFIQAGYKGKEIDKIARDFIGQAGFADYFGHGLGHSVGLYIHEEPRLSPSEETVILANVTETIEPGIYIEGFGGVRIEDLVVVKEDGYINFTHSEKNLIEI